MEEFAHVLQLFSVAVLGVYAGAMLTEGFLLVPYWKSLSPPEFFAWYSANDRRLVGFFGPLTILGPVASLAAALTALWSGADGGWPTAAAAALMLVAIAMFPLCFQRANESFAAAELPAADLRAALDRWSFWHWVRIGVSIAALALSVAGLM